MDEFLKARAAHGLTQAQVALKIGTTQSAVARIESGCGKHSPSLATLTKYAEALGYKLEVRLVRNARSARNLTGRSSVRASRAAELANPDLPVTFVAEALASIAEPCELATPFVPRGRKA